MAQWQGAHPLCGRPRFKTQVPHTQEVATWNFVKWSGMKEWLRQVCTVTYWWIGLLSAGCPSVMLGTRAQVQGPQHDGRALRVILSAGVWMREWQWQECNVTYWWIALLGRMVPVCALSHIWLHFTAAMWRDLTSKSPKKSINSILFWPYQKKNDRELNKTKTHLNAVMWCDVMHRVKGGKFCVWRTS